jgi:hypothetical protein
MKQGKAVGLEEVETGLALEDQAALLLVERELRDRVTPVVSGAVVVSILPAAVGVVLEALGQTALHLEMAATEEAALHPRLRGHQ